MASPSGPPRLYFGYGSNLSLTQMKSRCPTSTYYALGFLPNYKWIIGERGYANVIKTAPEEKHEVFGMLYALEEQDEENLDIAEGVPHAYYKRELDIVLVSKLRGTGGCFGDEEADRGEEGELGDRAQGGETVVKALVYVDERRLGVGICKEEYVHRINRGIRDAKGKGMGDEWVRKYVRPFVREEDVPGEVDDPFHPSNGEAYKEEALQD